MAENNDTHDTSTDIAEALAKEVRALLVEVDELEREVNRLEGQNHDLLRRIEAAEALADTPPPDIQPTDKRSERAQRLESARQLLQQIPPHRPS